ncbi:unnamed protein product (macronuclear) [Paramecium tetraurelia]|uniref:Uncharacterized protein n=1 Tax=Paramecium tetraurelia TaxID=5888 RepID=A0DIK7_PARTE|nr:uncharacterized protein GSPATT00017231001 [Paramecium tetraurelia]CAK82874.1 unnamed protein product [Paramecium tetraurelia]|eukprot:XP_001450271.1 hypothetical protein (macronuclear) [Paramecium tetraurelia strain d4-2]
MQLQKSKIKPPFLLDGIAAANKGKVLSYRPEKDVHLGQFFYNFHMHQMMSRFKQDRLSQRNLPHSLSKSFDQTINQSKGNIKSGLHKASSPSHKSFVKAPNNTQISEISRSLSKEHFVTFLDSLITTVQNVQQLVITYLPKEQIEGAIIKQQKELKKINQATQLLTKQLRANSLTQRKEVENVKTQKNFSKLPQIKKVDISMNSQTERGREQSTRYRKTPGATVAILTQKTLERHNQKTQEEYENNGFEPYESNQDAQIKQQLPSPNECSENNNQSLKSSQQNKQVQIGLLPSLRAQQQQQPQKKYQKEIQLVLSKPKQHKLENSSNRTSQSPIQLKCRSVGIREAPPIKNQQQSLKPEFKKISSVKMENMERQKSKIQSNSKAKINGNGRKENIPIQIKIIDVDAQIEKTELNSKTAKTNTQVPVEIVEEVVQNFTNESGLFQTQTETEQNKVEQEKIQLQGNTFFQIQEEEEHKESIDKLDESNDFKKESNKILNEKQDDNNFIKMIQEQVKQNDERLLKQQQTDQSNNLLESMNQNNMLKVVESIEAKDEDNIVNPLDDSEDQKKNEQPNSLFVTLEPTEQKNQQEAYQNEGFEQDS